jgi:diketogulonate reductase-like aldo/keto reductase
LAEQTVVAVEAAITLGYRLIDAAAAYFNERVRTVGSSRAATSSWFAV